MYPFPAGQYPYPILSPEMSQVAASWHTPSMYPLSPGAGFRSPYPSALPISTSSLPSDFYRFSPTGLIPPHPGLSPHPPHLSSHPAIVTPGPKQELPDLNHRCVTHIHHHYAKRTKRVAGRQCHGNEDQFLRGLLTFPTLHPRPDPGESSSTAGLSFPDFFPVAQRPRKGAGASPQTHKNKHFDRARMAISPDRADEQTEAAEPNENQTQDLAFCTELASTTESIGNPSGTNEMRLPGNRPANGRASDNQSWTSFLAWPPPLSRNYSPCWPMSIRPILDHFVLQEKRIFRLARQSRELLLRTTRGHI
ncbi:hypothetical protein Zmor_008026 [Zophobas morio]|uniref:Uncharacterized protein n=1 Tax=Zophobas morio TaxID=2755281 RepID=A0AA38MQ15_9CUCU|nr:hypothetical protein Zmor_008026 [Zophobas morio]